MDEIDEIREVTEDVLRNSKKKREPSKWNLFLKDCAPKQPKDMAFGDKIKACSVEYKKAKDSQSQGSQSQGSQSQGSQSSSAQQDNSVSE